MRANTPSISPRLNPYSCSRTRRTIDININRTIRTRGSKVVSFTNFNIFFIVFLLIKGQYHSWQYYAIIINYCLNISIFYAKSNQFVYFYRTFCYDYRVIYNPKTIEDYILSYLQKGSFNTSELLEKIKTIRPKTTKQGFYQSLRKLKKDEVVVIYSKRVSLSHIWINTMSEYFATAKRLHTLAGVPSEDFLQLEDGDKISYTFKSPTIADMFWGHAFGVLASRTQQDEPVYIYNPHEWFMIARHKSEKIVFNEIISSGKQLFVLIGNNDPLDKYIANEFDGIMSQYYMCTEKLFEKENYYLNIFDDFTIEAYLDEKTTSLVNQLYKETTVFTEDIREQLKQIVNHQGKTKLTISRNKRKAQKFKTVFKKYFYIKK